MLWVSPIALIKGSRFLRFLATGVINTGFGYAVYALLIWAGFEYFLAAPTSFLLGTLFNYFSNSYLVFFYKGHISSLLRFCVIYSFLLFVNLLLIAVMVKVGISELIAGALAVAPHAVLGYVLLKRFVFVKYLPRSQK